MIAVRAFCAFLGAALVFGVGPMYGAQFRKVFWGPNYVPARLLISSAAFGLGIVLLGVTVWLS